MAITTTLRSVVADIKQYRRTYWLAIVASFGGMLFGWDTGLIGGVLTEDAFLRSFHLDPNKPSFANLQGNIVSVLQAGCFFGAGLSFFLSDRFGRRGALFIAVFTFISGSVVQTLSDKASNELAMLFAGRVVGGLGVGIVSAVVPTYICESANKEIRGRCIGCMQLFNVSGIMLSYFVNYGLNLHYPDSNAAKWRIAFALQMLPGMLLFLGLLTTKETPRWCVEKGRLQDARANLSHIRGKPVDHQDVLMEFNEIVHDFDGKERLSLVQQVKAIAESKRTLYPVMMSLALQFFQQWSGTNSINYYSPQIFRTIGLSSRPASLFATGIYGVVKVVMTTLSLTLAVEQVGRKWCLAVGGLGQSFAMFYIGGATLTRQSSSSTALDGTTYFAIVCVYLYVTFYSFAWGHMPFILTSECSPNHVRSFVLAVALMLQWLCNFAIAKLTPIMLARITYGTYLVFGSACFLMAVFALVFVPETKNVPQESVKLLFEGDIVQGALRDCKPAWQRARQLKDVHLDGTTTDDASRHGQQLAKSVAKRHDVAHVEHIPNNWTRDDRPNGTTKTRHLPHQGASASA